MTKKDVRYDDINPIEVAPGVFHLAVQDEENIFNNIPYIIVDNDEAVFIDPGSASKEFYNIVLEKAKKIIDLKKIKYMIVQHQDPDLCAALPLFEPFVADDCKIIAPIEAQVLVNHYGLTKELIGVDDGESITFGSNRKLEFFMTPYCHFVGSMITYDITTKTLFSSDIFGGFTPDNLLQADDELYPMQLSTFLGEYLGSKRALEYAVKRIELLDKEFGIDLICPQHGCIITKELIGKYVQVAQYLQVGQQVTTLAHKYGIELEGRD